MEQPVNKEVAAEALQNITITSDGTSSGTKIILNGVDITANKGFGYLTLEVGPHGGLTADIKLYDADEWKAGQVRKEVDLHIVSKPEVASQTAAKETKVDYTQIGV